MGEPAPTLRNAMTMRIGRHIRRMAPLVGRAAPLALLAALALLALAQGWHRFLTLDQLALHRTVLREAVDANRLLALAAFMGAYAGAVALSLPGAALLTIAGGLLFGWLAGAIAAVFAATLGASLLFLVARTALGDILAARAGGAMDRLRKGFQEDAFAYLLFLRLVPAFPFWLVNLAPALLGVRAPVFMAATFVGIIPGTFAFALVGAGLDSIIDAQIRANPGCAAASAEDCRFDLSPAGLVTPQILLALGALGVLALVPVLVRKLRARRLANR